MSTNRLWRPIGGYFREKNYGDVDKGGNSSEKDKYIDWGCALEGESTGCPSGFVMGNDDYLVEK